jgi:hypothetical protein
MMRALKENSVTLARRKNCRPKNARARSCAACCATLTGLAYVERYNQIIAAAQGKPLGS